MREPSIIDRFVEWLREVWCKLFGHDWALDKTDGVEWCKRCGAEKRIKRLKPVMNPRLVQFNKLLARYEETWDKAWKAEGIDMRLIREFHAAQKELQDFVLNGEPRSTLVEEYENKTGIEIRYN
ncbi:MAG: hypothetical protein KBA03_03710 [Anaerolineaceae bacterium]|nr:hypothetical protein [Anaerolineaceae bacterium]